MVASNFSKNQDSEVTLERARDWGTSVMNRRCYQQWINLAGRLGMTREMSEQVRVLRTWMEQKGPIASISRTQTRRRSYESAFNPGTTGGFQKRFRD